MIKVIAPNQQYTGLSASVMFVNGVGETDNKNLLKWFEEKGYTVECLEPTEGEALAAFDPLIKDAMVSDNLTPESEDLIVEAEKPAKKGK